MKGKKQPTLTAANFQLPAAVILYAPQLRAEIF